MSELSPEQILPVMRAYQKAMMDNGATQNDAMEGALRGTAMTYALYDALNGFMAGKLGVAASPNASGAPIQPGMPAPPPSPLTITHAPAALPANPTTPNTPTLHPSQLETLRQRVDGMIREFLGSSQPPNTLTPARLPLPPGSVAIPASTGPTHYAGPATNVAPIRLDQNVQALRNLGIGV